MKTAIEKIGGNYKVTFTHGVQTFTLDYSGAKKECQWYKDRLDECFKSFASQQQPSREKIIEVLEDSGELLNLFASKLGCQTEDAPLKSDAEDYGSLDLLRRIREVISELSEEQGEEYDCDTCRHYPCIYQTKITGNGKLKKGNCGDYDDEQPRPEQDEIKEISCAFFRFWWNADGNNTEQGFDYWWKENKNKYISTPSEPKPTDEELLKFAVYIYDSLNRSYNLKGMKVFVEEYLNPS